MHAFSTNVFAQPGMRVAVFPPLAGFGAAPSPVTLTAAKKAAAVKYNTGRCGTLAGHLRSTIVMTGRPDPPYLTWVESGGELDCKNNITAELAANYQSYRGGLKVDGKIGPKTTESLKADAGIPTTTSVNGGGGGGTPGVTSEDKDIILPPLATAAARSLVFPMVVGGLALAVVGAVLLFGDK